MDKHPDDLKDEGNQALKAGDFFGAIKAYSQAIELDRSNAIYYSNRAAAYLKLNKLGEALKDANSAIEAQRNYAKGYSHKATALELLGKSEEAKAALQAGLEADPSSTLLKDRLADFEARKARAAAGASSSASSSSSSSSRAGANFGSANGPSASSSSAAASSAGGIKGSIVKHGRVAMLACTLLYLLPLLGNSRLFYSAAIILGLAVHGALMVIDAGGQVKFDKEFAARCMESFWAPTLMGGMTALVAGPSFLLLLGSSIIDLVAAGETIRGLASANPSLGVVSNGIDKLAAFALPKIAGKSADEVATYSRSRKWEVANAGLTRVAASADVWGTIMIFLSLFSPADRSLMGAVLGYQTMTAKYSLSEPHREVWAGLHFKIRSLVSSLPIPAVLKLFDTAAAFLRKQVKSPDELRREAEERYRQQQAGGAAAAAPGAPGCVVQ